MEYLLLFAWPGNVRQLANEVRRAVALVDADASIEPAQLSDELRASRRTIAGDAPPRDDQLVVPLDAPLAAVLETVERAMVARALDRTHDHYEEAARRLGISRKGLFLKRRRWGLQPPSPPAF
jgi:DNA-binding NtrC family response regulator